MIIYKNFKNNSYLGFLNFTEPLFAKFYLFFWVNIIIFLFDNFINIKKIKNYIKIKGKKIMFKERILNK